MSGNKQYRVLRGFHRIDHDNGTEPYYAVGSVYDGPIEKWYLEDDPDFVRPHGVRGVRVGGDGAGPLLVEITPAEARKLKADESASDDKPADSGKEN